MTTDETKVVINAPDPKDVSEEDRKNRVIPDLSFTVPMELDTEEEKAFEKATQQVCSEVFYPDYMYRGAMLFHIEGETYEPFTGHFNGMDWQDGKEV